MILRVRRKILKLLHSPTVVTPKIFDLVLFIKIWPGNKTFPFVKIYPFVIVDFCFKWKLSKDIVGLEYSL